MQFLCCNKNARATPVARCKLRAFGGPGGLTAVAPFLTFRVRMLMNEDRRDPLRPRDDATHTGRLSPNVGWVLLFALTALYVGWGLAPEATLYRQTVTPRHLVVLASLSKMAYLLAGALLAFACRDRLEEGNPARPAWALLSVGLFATLAGQMSLAPFLLTSGEAPFPSVADLFYVLAYPSFIAAFLVFLRAYRESGFPVGSLGERISVVLGLGVLGGAAAAAILRPLASAGGELLERILSVAYPLLDLLLLGPLALVFRIAARARGNPVGRVFGLLLAGFAGLALADVGFGYFTLGEQHLDPYLHATYLLSYGLIAWGAQRQLRLLKR